MIKVEQGKNFKEGVIEDAKSSDGAQQAFTKDADGKGYVQEIAIPWKLLTRNGNASTPAIGSDSPSSPTSRSAPKGDSRSKILQAGSHSQSGLHLHGKPMLGHGHSRGKGAGKPSAVPSPTHASSP